MTINMYYYVSGFLLLASIIADCNALSCYLCSSGIDEDCGDGKLEAAHTPETCHGSLSENCQKRLITVSGETRVYRQCEADCNEIDTEKLKKYCCNTDGCNDSELGQSASDNNAGIAISSKPALQITVVSLAILIARLRIQF